MNNIILRQNLAYRPGVGLAIINSNNLLFIGERIDSPGSWQMPQGGIDENEQPEEAVLREMKEEIGTDQATILAWSKEWLHYELPNALIPKLWNGKYRGQKQLWFLLRFIGNDSDINIHTEHPEFSSWKWSDFDSVTDKIVPFKRKIYSKILAEFRPLIKDNS
jgi:putative (di)nucleoside polyphosphate hydrolase